MSIKLPDFSSQIDDELEVEEIIDDGKSFEEILEEAIREVDEEIEAELEADDEEPQIFIDIENAETFEEKRAIVHKHIEENGEYADFFKQTIYYM